MNNHWLDPHLTTLRTGAYELKRVQGDVDSDIVLIAPPPTEEEVVAQFAWCNAEAKTFFSFLAVHTGMRPDEFLIVPAAFRVQTTKNFKQGDAALGREIIAAAALSPKVKAFVCIGSDAFKAFFGFGKKPSMTMLAGTIMRVTQTNFKPLLVFPDLGPLLYTYDTLKQVGLRRGEIGQLLSERTALESLIAKKRLFQKVKELVK